MKVSVNRGSHRLALVCSLTAIWLFAPMALSQDRQLAGAIPSEKTWAKSIELVRDGRYDQADKLLTELVGDGPTSSSAQKWVREWIEQEKHRYELTEADYQKYIDRAQKHLAEDEVLDTLDWAYRAKLSAPSPDVFENQAWLKDLREAGMKEATELQEKEEWRDAHHIFSWMSLVFEDDKVVEHHRDDCFEHARLESIYSQENEDWEDALEGIDPSMVEDALWRIDQKYVVEPDFQEITAAGLDRILLLADSPALQKRFVGLTGERGRDFRMRVGRQLRNMREERNVTERDSLRSFRRILRINDETAELPRQLVVREFMDAALSKLDDFTSMIWPSDFREFEKHTRGDFIGVGIQIRNKYNPELKDTEILVVSPLEDSPAYRAGIQANDVITAVNGDSLKGVAVTKAVTMITGPLGTTVNLTIRRMDDDKGEEAFLDFALKRQEIKIQSVKGFRRDSDNEQVWDFMIDPDMGIAYIRPTSFQENTVDDMRTALSEAKAKGMRGLILDLRNNPGGLLKTAVEMSEMFLSDNDRIVSTKGRRSPEWSVEAEGEGLEKDIPLIVLINEGSASASEIVTGAIQDHHRGTIIGERSFGKFSVQNLIQLVRSEAHLKLTTARYYLPSGRSLHREEGATEWGVKPDIVIPLVPKEMAKIRFMQRDADVIGAIKTSSELELKEPLMPIDDEKDADEQVDNGDKSGDQKMVADEQAAEDDTKTADTEDEVKQEEKDENNRPNRDPQLQTALLAMRIHLLQDHLSRMAVIPQMEPEEVNR